MLATWASKVVPTDKPLRCPDISVDTGRGAVSEYTAGSDGSDPLAVDLSGPLGMCGAAGVATTAEYVAPPSGEPICRTPVAACSTVAPVDFAGSGAESAPGAVRLVAGSEDSPRAGQLVGLTLPRDLG